MITLVEKEAVEVVCPKCGHRSEENSAGSKRLIYFDADM